MNKAHPHLEPSDNGRRNRHNRQIYSFIVFNLKLSFSISLGGGAPPALSHFNNFVIT